MQKHWKYYIVFVVLKSLVELCHVLSTRRFYTPKRCSIVKSRKGKEFAFLLSRVRKTDIKEMWGMGNPYDAKKAYYRN